MIRQWEILRIIKRFKWGISAREISRRLNVPHRTVYRDLEVLVMVTPIFSEKVRLPHGRSWRYVWKLKENDVF